MRGCSDKGYCTVWILVCLFVAATIADIVTSWFILPADANPLLVLGVSVWILYAIKAAVAIWAFWAASQRKFKDEGSYFFFMSILIYGTLVMAVGVWSNTLGIINPTIVDAAAAQAASSKIQAYTLIVSIFFLIPIFLNMLSFEIYNRTKKFIEFKRASPLGKV